MSTFAEYAAERGWRYFTEDYMAPADPSYEGPWEEWEGEWLWMTAQVLGKTVVLVDGMAYSQVVTVPGEPSWEPAWKALVDVAEAALRHGIEENGVPQA